MSVLISLINTVISTDNTLTNGQATDSGMKISIKVFPFQQWTKNIFQNGDQIYSTNEQIHDFVNNFAVIIHNKLTIKCKIHLYSQNLSQRKLNELNIPKNTKR